MNKKKEITTYRVVYAAVVGVMSVLLAVVLLVFTNKEPVDPGLTPEPVPSNIVACTMDAKICPDGSAVGRVGPNCEFAACPQAPEGVTLLLKGQSLPYTGVGGSTTSFRAEAFGDDQLQELLLQVLGPIDPPGCYTTVTGEHCITHKDFTSLSIDWRKQFVVAASLGVRSSGGYDISITGFEEVGNQVYIFVQEETVGKGCMATEALTNPYVVALLDLPAETAKTKKISYKVSTMAGPACQE